MKVTDNKRPKNNGFIGSGTSNFKATEPPPSFFPLVLIFVAAITFTLVGCAGGNDRLEDGYQFGDITNSILDRQAAYCSGADPAARALLIAVARSKQPDFPENGICTDLFTLLVAPDGSPQ